MLQAQDVAKLMSSHLEEVSACKGKRWEMLLPACVGDACVLGSLLAIISH